MKSKLSSNISIIILFAFCIVMTCNGQKITVSPASVPIWGQTTGYSHIGIEYKSVGVHYFNGEDSFDGEQWPAYSNVGISFVPIGAGILNFGLIAFPKQFPLKGSKRINVWVELSIPIRNFSFRYIHISNAYHGIVNPGVDLLSLSYSF